MAFMNTIHRVWNHPSFIAGCCRIGGAGSLFLLNIALGRFLDVDDFGVFSYAVDFAGLFAMTVTLGFPTALMRFIPQHLGGREWSLLKGVVLHATSVTSVVGVAGSAAMVAVALLVPLRPETRQACLYAAWLGLPAAFVFLFRRALQAVGRVAASMIPEDIVLAGFMIVAVGALNASGGASVAAVMPPYVVITSAAALGMGLLLWRALPPEARGAAPHYQRSPWTGVAVVALAAEFAALVVTRADIVMLGFYSDMESVGLYAAASRLSIFSIFAAQVASIVAPPIIARAYHTGDYALLRRTYLHAMALSVIGSGVPTLVIVARPDIPLMLFGSDYEGASALLVILSVGQFVNAATGPCGFGLVMVGRQKTYALSVCVIGAAKVLGNFIVLPQYGALGGALLTAAAAATSSLWQFAVFWGMLRRMRSAPETRT